MWNGRRIAVVIPALDESERIAAVVSGVPPWVDAIIAVDDGSRDGTASAARSTGDGRVTVEVHPENRGVGAAIATGYARGLSLGADVLVVMAGDDQMDPGDLPAVVAPVADGHADYVKGNRFAHAERSAMPPLRRLAGKGLSLATRMVTAYPIDDSQCGYTALSADAARRIPLHDLWPRYGYPNDLLVLLSREGLRVAEVAVRPVYQGEKSGIRPWHAAVVLWVLARRLRRPRRAGRARATT